MKNTVLMSPPEMVRALCAKGLTQVAIADKLGVAQSFVSYLYHERRKTVCWEIGLRLADLYARHILRRRLALVRLRR